VQDRRAFVRGVGLAILGISLGSLAQRAGTMPRIAFLAPGPNPREPAFWEGMRQLGYVDGKSIVVDRRSAEIAGSCPAMAASAELCISRRNLRTAARIVHRSLGGKIASGGSGSASSYS